MSEIDDYKAADEWFHRLLDIAEPTPEYATIRNLIRSLASGDARLCCARPIHHQYKYKLWVDYEDLAYGFAWRNTRSTEPIETRALYLALSREL